MWSLSTGHLSYMLKMSLFYLHIPRSTYVTLYTHTANRSTKRVYTLDINSTMPPINTIADFPGNKRNIFDADTSDGFISSRDYFIMAMSLAIISATSLSIYILFCCCFKFDYDARPFPFTWRTSHQNAQPPSNTNNTAAIAMTGAATTVPVPSAQPQVNTNTTAPATTTTATTTPTAPIAKTITTARSTAPTQQSTTIDH